MALLAAPTTMDRSVSMPQVATLGRPAKNVRSATAHHIITGKTGGSSSSSSTTLASEISSSLGPLVARAIELQQLLSSTAFLLLTRTYFAASIGAAALLFASRVVALRTLLISRFLAVNLTALVYNAVHKAWDSKRSRRFRKRLELELFVLLFGAGQSLFLILFWPGWIVLGVAAACVAGLMPASAATTTAAAAVAAAANSPTAG